MANFGIHLSLDEVDMLLHQMKDTDSEATQST